MTLATDVLHQAACKDAPSSMFFPNVGPIGQGRTAAGVIQAWRDACAPALALCAVCPIAESCLADAIDSGDLDGVRGGKVPPELYEITGKRRVGQRRGRPQRAGHGTRGKYVNGCRCEPCTAANRQYVHDHRWRSP
jgi:hypothetical protein